jgi:hypothetical protein
MQKFALAPILVLIILALLAFPVAAQNQPLITNNTSGKSVKEGKQSSRKIRYIISNNTGRTLYGNKCVEEFTSKMGFRYLAIPPGQPGNRSKFGRFIHNFGVKTVLLFRNGPFWKHKVKKRIRECRQKMGDFVG